jgi:hypothetical protein
MHISLFGPQGSGHESESVDGSGGRLGSGRAVQTHRGNTFQDFPPSSFMSRFSSHFLWQAVYALNTLCILQLEFYLWQSSVLVPASQVSMVS